MKVLFMRHALTQAQAAELGHVDLDLSYLAQQDIESRDEAAMMVDTIVGQVYSLGNNNDAILLYGVIPTPLRAALVSGSEPFIVGNKSIRLMTYEAFNIKRTVEGEKPTFEHAGWLLTGVYKVWMEASK